MIIDNFRTPNGYLKRERAKKYGIPFGGLYKSNNIKYAGYDLDIEIYGIWLEAIDLCAIRSTYIPNEILDDFYYTHKED